MTISVRLGEEIEARLEALAERTHRTKSFYIKRAITEMLEDMEDYYLGIEALRDKNDKVWTLEEIKQGKDLLQ